MFSKWKRKRRKRKKKQILNNADFDKRKYDKQSNFNTKGKEYTIYSRLFISV